LAYTLTQAAAAAERNRSSILRAIKSGKLSATRDAATGGWLIEPAELHRVYPVADAPGAAPADALPRNSDALAEIRELRARLEATERHLADKDGQISDLRRRLDVADEERRRLTAVLADQRAAPAPAPAALAPTAAPRRPWLLWRRR
jgi:hypothetical protein